MSAVAITPPPISPRPARLRWLAPFLLGVFGALFLAGVALAQAQQDPPSRVGRLSDVGGSVFLAPDDSETGWQPVGINYPVTMGDNVWVSAESRAEIDFGAGQLRLAHEANVHFSQLDDRQFSAFLANGRASLRLRVIDTGERAKLDTPNAQVDILRPGLYRLDTDADSTHTTLVVREGEAEIRVGDRSATVYGGQTASVQGNGFGAAMMVRNGLGTDGFDAYASDRDRRIEASGISELYVSSYVPGVADLNAYGTWETTSTYGAVWYPSTISVDWVPYQDGTWTYVRPWGWTWVDNAPWGWAPFHYGRWMRLGARWGWAPGEYVRRPIYSPALVAWYGGPSGTSWSSGYIIGPTFGWVPLSWGEPYWPLYRHSSDYWRRTNQPVAVNVRQMPTRPPQRFNYANARIPGAVTAAPVEVLTHRRPVGPNHYRLPAQAFASAPLTTAPLDARPAARPMSIDKMPARTPMPASDFASRSRPDGRTPQMQTIPRQGAINDPRSAAGQPYVPNNRPQPGPRQHSFDPARQLIQSMPAPAQTPQIQSAPAFQQAPTQQYVPQRRPVAIPQAAPMQIAPAGPAYLPQQRLAPIQRAPMPMPAAPAPSSIAPASNSIAPAGAIAAPAPQHAIPQQPHQVQPGETPGRPGMTR